MKTLGLIGGTSWESTVDYYQLLNEGARDRIGGLHSCRMVLSSVDFEGFAALMRAGEWDALGERLVAEARLLARAGAAAIVLCTNTMHKVASEIVRGIDIPLLDIRDACGRALKAAGAKRPLLLGTRYTMEDDFFTRYLRDRFGLNAVTPSPPDQRLVDSVIFEELCRGKVSDSSRQACVGVVANSPSADAVIFGCTEIGLLLDAPRCGKPIFDNLRLHTAAALDFALQKD